MDTRYLRSFLKIADTGSISRAAVSLGIAQPSLSQQLLRLEDEVGLVLFRRTSKGVALTEAGRIFQEHARHLIRFSEQAIQDTQQATSEVSGSVILAVPYSISELAGMQLVEAFMTHAPGISFRLVEAMTGSIRGWLDSGKVDLGILHDLGTLRHLSARHLATEELFVVGPAGRFGTMAEPMAISGAELSGMPMLLPGPQHGLRQIIEHTADRLKIDLIIAQEIDALRHVGAMIAKGYGFSILPIPAIQKDLADGTVSIARVGDGSIRRSLSLVRNASQLVTHASTRCEDLTLNVLMQMIDKGIWLAKPGRE